MRAPLYPWNLRPLYTSCPSLGCLMDLCEENYRVLIRLVPQLREMEGYLRSGLPQGMDLHLEILEQTPYTTLLHLTYYFSHDAGVEPDPDTTLRAYHDAAQVEVQDLRQTALPLARGPHFPTLEQKWKANQFLSKWLAFCVTQGHLFTSLPALGSGVARSNRMAASA